MMNEHDNGAGKGQCQCPCHGGQGMIGQKMMGIMSMMGPYKKEFIAAKLEKKAGMLKLELEFIEKMKKLAEKVDFGQQK